MAYAVEMTVAPELTLLRWSHGQGVGKSAYSYIDT